MHCLMDEPILQLLLSDAFCTYVVIKKKKVLKMGICTLFHVSKWHAFSGTYTFYVAAIGIVGTIFYT